MLFILILIHTHYRKHILVCSNFELNSYYYKRYSTKPVTHDTIMNEKFIALNHKVCSKYNICEKISVRMFSSYKCLQVNINLHYQI